MFLVTIIHNERWVSVYSPSAGGKAGGSFTRVRHTAMNQKNNVFNLACEPIPNVRIGVIGTGNRGLRAIRRYAAVRGAQITAVADINESGLLAAAEELARTGRPAAKAFLGEDGWKELCAYKETDLVYICTPWSMHAAMACHAMTQGKHAAVEVPAATSVDDCLRLVETAERTRRHCFMLENCCYDAFALTTVRLAEEGLLGTITHAEGAYIHDVMDDDEVKKVIDYKLAEWNVSEFSNHAGNAYPTHGLGPACLAMGVNRGDRLKSIVSLSSDAARPRRAKINSSIIKTQRGRTIGLSIDVETPRPYSRGMVTCGTKGFTRKYPRRCIMFAGDTEDEAYANTPRREESYEHSVTRRWGREARRQAVDNEMNIVMDCRLVYCLNAGLPLDLNVYDAAAWSSITELSEISARLGGAPTDIPDFTHGLWENAGRHRFFI